MSKRSIFQPGHDGKHAAVPVHLGMTVSHSDSREHIGEHKSIHAGNIARDGGKPKGRNVIPLHGGMTRVTQGRAITGGGQAASALDSLSGAKVPAGRVTTAPGWGDAGVTSGHPFAKPPGGKNLRPAPISFGMRSRGPSGDPILHELGSAILDAAFSVASPDDKAAHGRGPDGKKK